MPKPSDGWWRVIPDHEDPAMHQPIRISDDVVALRRGAGKGIVIDTPNVVVVIDGRRRLRIYWKES